MRKIYLMLLLVVMLSTAQSATITWNNSVTSGDWAAGTSWVGGMVPGLGDDVVFNGAPNVLVTFAANVPGVLSVSITNSSTVTFRTTASTPYTFGATTAPILTIDGTSVFQQGTSSPVVAAGGGINLSVSGTSSVAIGGIIKQLSGSGSRITVTAGATFNVNGSFYCQSELVNAGPNFSNAAFITNANPSTSNLNFNAGAYVEINRNTGLPSTMPYANWDATATLKITGNTTTTAGVHTWQLNGTTPQKLGNFIFDCPNLAPAAFSLTFNNSSQVLVDEFKGDVQILNSNGKIVSFAASNSTNQTITFSGDLIIGSGVADFRPMNSVTANAGVVTWNCKKNVSIAAGTFGMSANTSTAHSIHIIGSSIQNIGLPAFTTDGIFSIEINNSGNGASLTSNTGNLKNITLTNGKLTAGNFNAVAGYNAGTVTGSSSNFVVTNGTGKLTIANTAAATSTLFPIGISSASYDPVRVNPASIASFSIGVKDATGGFTNPEGNAGLTCNREWDISAAGTPGSTLVEFEPDATAGCPVVGTKVVGHNTGGAWIETASAAGPNFSYSASFSSFSPFGVGVAGGFACVAPNPGTVSGNSPLYPSATATYTSNGDAGGGWTSTNTSVATVDPGTGLVTAVAPGTSNITYTVSNGCGSPLAAFKTVTVTNTNTWVGASGSDWATASNWSLGVVPTFTQDVVFNAFTGTVKFLSLNTIAPCASITITNASDVTFEDQDNGADSIGTASSPCVMTVNGNSALRTRTVGANSLTGGVLFNTTGASVIEAGSTFDMKSGTFNKILMRGGSLNVNGAIMVGNETIAMGVSNSGFINRLAGTLTFGMGSLVEANRTSGLPSQMPLANWDATSTIRIINCSGTVGLTGWAAGTHSLGNIEIDATGMNIPVYNLGFSSATALLVNEIKGDFTVLNANGKVITLAAITAANNTQAQTVTFKGNVLVSNAAAFRPFNYTGSGSGSGVATWNFEKNVTLPQVGASINSSTAHTMNFTGAIAQSLSLGGFATDGMFSLNVNNGGNGVTLGANTGNLKNITLTNGKLTLGNFNAVAGYNAGTVTGNASNYIVTNGTGVLTINNVTTGNAFPIGASKYNPILVESGSGHSWSAKVSDGITASPGFTTDKAVLVTWDITPSVNPPAAGADVTFQFDETTQTGASFNIGSSIQAWRKPSSLWVVAGTPVLAAGVAGARTVTVEGLTGFSPYGLANIDGPLPVSIVSFSGERKGEKNILKWTTASEFNNRGFEVQRSVDGVSYSAIGFENSQALNGNSNRLLNYSYTDVVSAGAKYYYRLRQVDFDNNSRLSSIVQLVGETPLTLAVGGMFPNPAVSNLSLAIHSPERKSISIMITDMNGRLIKNQQAIIQRGSNTVNLDVSKFRAGSYMVKLVCDTGCEINSGRFIKL